MKIGIIGLGFVGGAVQYAHNIHSIKTILHDPLKNIIADRESLYSCDGIFICVPSPMGSDGQCDTSILESVVDSLKNYQGVIISKVTADPSKYKQLQEKYINLVHAPEFLVAATAKEDYINGEFAIIGGKDKFCEQALDIIRLAQPKIKNYKFCSIQEAALAKYTINSFLATKVMFLNQLMTLSDALNANYDTVADCIRLDSRIGNSHTMVPGPDGKYGFGGACFPKDTSALNYLAKSLGVDFSILNEVIVANKKVRKDI